MGNSEYLIKAAHILEEYKGRVLNEMERDGLDREEAKILTEVVKITVATDILREFALMGLCLLPREDRVQPKLTLEQEIALALYRDGQTRDIEWENVPGYLHGTLFSKARAIVTSLREIGLLLETEQRDAMKAVLNAADNYIDYGIGDDLHALTDSQRGVVRKLVGPRWGR